MSYLAGIHDLAYVFTRVGATADAGARQDWVSVGANVLAGAGKFVWYKKSHGVLKEALAKAGTKVLPTPTAIIDVTMVVVAAIDLLNGFGAPNNGSGFSTGVDRLKTVDSKLELAIPDRRDWAGDAADAYTAQNAALRELVAKMQELDRKIQAIVADQGAEIVQAHRTLSILGFALVAAQGVALLLYLIPIVGPEYSMLFQVVAAFAATATVVTQETLAVSNSMVRADRAELVAAEYLALGKKAELPGTFAKIEVPGAEETKVGSFTAISDGLSAFTMPTVTSLAAAAGESSSAPQRALMTSLGYGDPSAEAALSALEADASVTDPTIQPVDIPEQAAPAAPAFTPPTLAQVTAASAQAAKLSGHASQQMNLVNQAMGSVQQVVSMAQQGQAAGPAAEATLADATHPADDTTHPASSEDDGAAGGFESSERAPVEASTAEGDETAGPQRVL